MTSGETEDHGRVQREIERIRQAQPLIAVVGSTATGKTGLSVDLARAVGGEIINADAMQLYRGMNIGTAKISSSEQHGVPHHLFDELDVHEEASVAWFQRAARGVVAAIRGRSAVPILVGGSGLYVRAVTDRIDFPGTDSAVRSQIEETAARLGPMLIHERLQALDPPAAAAIDPANVRRTIRALEVIELTGKPFSASMPSYTYLSRPTIQIGLEMPRPVLHARIERRVDAMIEGGLIAETEQLLAQGLRGGTTAARAIGYAQAMAVADGTMGLDQAREEIATGTRRLVRKQDTWFHRDPRISWINADPSAEEPKERLLRAIRLIDVGLDYD